MLSAPHFALDVFCLASFAIIARFFMALTLVRLLDTLGIRAMIRLLIMGKRLGRLLLRCRQHQHQHCKEP